MQVFMNITKALSDQNRVRALLALKGRELCVCQIIELLGLAPSTVSKHMSVLRNAGLVIPRKEGLWMYYRLPEDPEPEIKTAIKWVCDSLANNETIKKDGARVKNILKMELVEICRRQNARTCCKTKGNNNNGR